MSCARVLACFAATFVTSCTGLVEPGVGSLNLAVSGEIVDAESVVATISGGAGEFEPIVAPLSVYGAGWSASISGIPAGPGRRFDVAAYDAGGAMRFAGSVTSDVLPGLTLDATLILQAWPPPPPVSDSAPAIHAVIASPGLVATDGEAWLEVTASDPDGDALHYAWWGACGSFAAPGLPGTVWTAPSQEGTCDVSIAVADQTGRSTTLYLPMHVQAVAP